MDPEQDFEPVYQPIKGKEDIIKDLKKSAKAADTVFLSSGWKASISRSRSSTIRVATDWTRPAERPRRTFFHRRGLSS